MKNVRLVLHIIVRKRLDTSRAEENRKSEIQISDISFQISDCKVTCTITVKFNAAAGVSSEINLYFVVM